MVARTCAVALLILLRTLSLAQQPTDRDREWAERKYREQQAALRVLGRLSYLPEPTLRAQKCDAAGAPQDASPMTAAALVAREAAEAVKKMSSSERWAVSRMRQKHHSRHTRRHPVSTNGLLVSLAREHGLVFCKGCPDPHTDGSNIGEVWESHWIPEDYDVDGEMVYTVPNDAHVPPYNAEELRGNIAFTERGGVRFVEKARYVQEAGAVALVIVDNGGCERGSDFECAPLGSRAQGGWGSAELWSDWVDVYIPVVMVMPRQGDRLRELMELEYSELRGVGMQHIPQIKRLTPAQLDVADAAFDILDYGGDATVNRAEVRALLHEQLGHAVRVQHEHARRTLAADNPDVARLSDQRLNAVIARHVDTHATKLHRADFDDDGVLSRREFVHHLTEGGESAMQFAERLVASEHGRVKRNDHHLGLQRVGALTGAKLVRIQVWSNVKETRIGRIRFRFDDGSTADFGAGEKNMKGSEVQRPAFELDAAAGERLVRVEVAGPRSLNGIQFITSEGRTSVAYGDVSAGTTSMTTVRIDGAIVGLLRSADRAWGKIASLDVV